MRVAISRSAQTELDAISDFIALDSRTRANTFVAELLDRCAALSQHAERYGVAFDYRDEQIRRVPYRSYLIFYSIRSDQVRIHHIVHSARDYMRLLFPED